MGFVHPLDEAQLHRICRQYKGIITIEDGVINGGAGSAVLEFMAREDCRLPVKQLGVPHEFIDHGRVAELQKLVGLDAGSIAKSIQGLLDSIGGR